MFSHHCFIVDWNDTGALGAVSMSSFHRAWLHTTGFTLPVAKAFSSIKSILSVIHRSSNIRSHRWPVITEEVIPTAYIQYSACFHCVLIKLIKAVEHFWLFHQRGHIALLGVGPTWGCKSCDMSCIVTSPVQINSTELCLANQHYLYLLLSQPGNVRLRSHWESWLTADSHMLSETGHWLLKTEWDHKINK